MDIRRSERDFNREFPNKNPELYHYTNPLGCTENKFSYPEDVGSANVVGTFYGLDGPGIESRWGREVPHLSGPVLGSTQLPIQWQPDLFLNWPERGVDHSPLPNALVKVRIYACRTESREQLFFACELGTAAKESAVVDGTSYCVILECLVTPIASIT